MTIFTLKRKNYAFLLHNLKIFLIFVPNFMQGESGESPGCPATVSGKPMPQVRIPGT